MDVKLPSGKVIKGIPKGTPREVIQQKAIASGLASPEDFQDTGNRNPEFRPRPSEIPAKDRGMLGSVYDFFAGEPGQRGVFSAPELNEMSMRAFKSGLGGLLEGDPAELQQIIATNYPEAEFGEMAGQPSVRLPSGDYFLNPEGVDLADVARFGVDVAAFVPAGKVAGAGLGALGKGAAIAGGTQAGLQSVEAATGGTFDPEDVAIEAATQGVFQVGEAGARAAAPYVSPIVKKIADRFRGGASAKPYEDAADALASRSMKRALPEVMADPEVMRAAADLDINVNPGVYSTSDIYRELENSLKMLPGSKLSANEKETVRQLGQRADELIEEYAGTLDKSAISQEVEERIGNSILDLEKQADAIYGTLDEAIPPSLKIRPTSTLDYIRRQAENFGEFSDLDPIVQKTFRRLNKEGGANYALVDQVRRDIGSALKGQGPFRDASQYQLKQLYGTLTDDTMKAAEFLGLGDEVVAAKELIKKRKALEEVTQSALGRDLSKSLMVELGLGVRQLQQGKVAKFDNVMAAVPKDMRQQVAISALNNIFAGGSQTAKGFSLSGFTNAYEAMQRNKEASKRLFNMIPSDAKKRLDDIYKVSKGLMEQNKRDLNNPSGTARAVIGAMDAPGGILDKLYRIGSRTAAGAAATSPFDAGAVGAMGGFMSALQSAKTKATQAADEMLSSPGFRDAMDKYIKGNQQAGNGILSRLPSARKWLAEQPPEVKRSVARQGFIQYLTNTEEADNEPNPNQ